MNRRVAITGIGVRAPGGGNAKEFWELISSGTAAIRTISLFAPSGFRSRVAGECDFDPVAEGFTAQEIRRMDRSAQLAVAATRKRSRTPTSTSTRSTRIAPGPASAAPSAAR